MITTASQYHRSVAYFRERMSGHSMDWQSQPAAFKHYPGLPSIPLSHIETWPGRDLRDLGETKPEKPGEPPSMDTLSRVLTLTHCITAQAKHGGSYFYYRNVASAGALYPFELYVLVRGAPDLADGLYHHSAADQSVTQVRSGCLGRLMEPLLGTNEYPEPSLVFFLTSIFFRSSWKYRDRAYRYCLLDTGHLLENLTLALRYERIPFRLHYNFDDRAVNEFLGVDPSREVCLAMCVAGPEASAGTIVSNPASDETLRAASRSSDREIDYPAIRAVHSASEQVPTSAQPGSLTEMDFASHEPLAPVSQEGAPEAVPYPDCMFKRRSMRNFIRSELGADSFAALLRAVAHGAGDFEYESSSVVSAGVATDRVEAWEPGFYGASSEGSWGLRRPGNFIEEMTHVCLDQSWLANCAAHFTFIADLDTLDRTFGPRGYRYAMLTAGRLGQRVYLACAALRIGCCGIGAFYDDEAARTLHLKKDTELLYLLGIGPVKKFV